MDNNIKMVPAICSQCGGTVEVNRSDETAKCPFCGASFIVEKAVNVYNVQHAHVDQAGWPKYAGRNFWICYRNLAWYHSGINPGGVKSYE